MNPATVNDGPSARATRPDASQPQGESRPDVGHGVEYLCFVETVKDCLEIELHRRRCRIARSELLYVALSLEASLWLAKRRVRSVFVWELVSPQRYHRVARRFADRAYQDFADAARGSIRFYRRCAWSPFRYYFYHVFLSLLILRTVTRQFRVAKLLLLPNDQRPLALLVSWPDSRDSVFRAVALTFVNRRRQAHTVVRARHRLALLGGLKPWMRLVSQFVRELVRRAKRQVVPLEPQSSRAMNGRGQSDCRGHAWRCDAVLSNWGYDFDQTLSLAAIAESEHLSEFRLVHLLWSPQFCQIPQRFPDHQPAYRLQVGVENRLVYFVQFILGIVAREAIGFVLRRWTDKRWISLPIAAPGLRFQHVHFLLSIYQEAYFSRRFARQVIRQFRPRLWLASDVDAPRVRAMLFTARTHGVDTASVSHGYNMVVLPSQRFIADHHFAWTTAMARNVVAGGLPAQRLKVVDARSEQNGRKCGVVHELASRPVRIVLVTSSLHGLWSTPHDPRRFRATIETLAHTTAARPNWHLVIKSHPVTDFYGYFDRVVRLSGSSNVRHVRERWTEDDFGQFTVAIFPGEISGAILDCQRVGVPVVFVADCTSQWHATESRRDIEGCGVVARDVDEAINAIEWLSLDARFRADVLETGQQFFARFVPRPQEVLPGLATALSQVLCETRN
jgi:hypothetical protein